MEARNVGNECYPIHHVAVGIASSKHLHFRTDSEDGAQQFRRSVVSAGEDASRPFCCVKKEPRSDDRDARRAPSKGVDEDGDAALRDPARARAVYADLNNAGPRHSSAFVKYDQTGRGYRPLPPETTPRVHIPVKMEEDMASNSRNGPVELVTASALDAEWKKFELEAMTKKGRKKRGGHRRGNLNARWRDQWCLSRAEALRHRFIHSASSYYS